MATDDAKGAAELQAPQPRNVRRLKNPKMDRDTSPMLERRQRRTWASGPNHPPPATAALDKVDPESGPKPRRYRRRMEVPAVPPPAPAPSSPVAASGAQGQQGTPGASAASPTASPLPEALLLMRMTSPLLQSDAHVAVALARSSLHLRECRWMRWAHDVGPARAMQYLEDSDTERRLAWDVPEEPDLEVEALDAPEADVTADSPAELSRSFGRRPLRGGMPVVEERP